MSELIGITDAAALTQWTNATAAGYYTVRFEEGIKTAYITSANEMVLPAPNAAMTIRDAIRMRGFAIHETSHPRYQADAFRILKENPMHPDSPLLGTFNMFLDVHAETNRAEEFAGDKKALSEFGAVLAADVSDDLLPNLKAKEVDDNATKMLAVMRAALEAESTWNLGMRAGFRELFDYFPGESNTIAEAVETKFDLKYALTRTAATPEQIWELARNVYTYVWGKPPESEINQPPSEDGEQGEEGEPGDGEGDAESEGEGDDGKEGKGKGEGDRMSEEKKPTPKPTKYAEGKSKKTIKVTRMVWSSHYESEGKGMGGHGRSMDFSDYKETAKWTPVPDSQHIVKDYDSLGATRTHPYTKLPAPEKNGSPGFASELRRLIQVESQAVYQQGYTSGKLSTSRLWRVGAPPIDEGRWNAQVFKRKTEVADVMDTCVSLLIDGSGSMSGDKYIQAYGAAMLINDTLTRILRIPTEINIFSSEGDVPTLGVVKRFDRQVSPMDIQRRFSDFMHEMSGNNDADSIAYIYNRLRHRKEKRKILIVLSDGSPADGNGDPHYGLRTVVQEIEAAGIVDIYGIGILTDIVKRFYSQSDVIHRAEDIQRALIKVLRSAIHKRSH